MATTPNNTFQGRSPEDILNELTSVKEMLNGMDDSISQLLDCDSSTDTIPVLRRVAKPNNRPPRTQEPQD